MLDVHIRPVGRLANQMSQYMLALSIANAAGVRASITGFVMPEWGLLGKQHPPTHDRVYRIRHHRFPYRSLIRQIRAGDVESIEIRSVAHRIEYYGSPELYRGTFSAAVANDATVSAIGADRLLIHVRAGDVLQNVHKDYHVLPYAYFDYLIERTNLNPLFVGELGDDPYSIGLRRRFPNADFMSGGSPLEDFETIRNATNVAIGVSTFSWLATWLSNTVENIYCPIAGYLNPRQRPDVNLLPYNDRRYHFLEITTGDLAPDFETYMVDGARSMRVRAMNPVKHMLLRAKQQVAKHST